MFNKIIITTPNSTMFTIKKDVGIIHQFDDESIDKIKIKL